MEVMNVMFEQLHTDKWENKKITCNYIYIAWYNIFFIVFIWAKTKTSLVWIIILQIC